MGLEDRDWYWKSRAARKSADDAYFLPSTGSAASASRMRAAVVGFVIALVLGGLAMQLGGFGRGGPRAAYQPPFFAEALGQIFLLGALASPIVAVVLFFAMFFDRARAAAGAGLVVGLLGLLATLPGDGRSGILGWLWSGPAKGAGDGIQLVLYAAATFTWAALLAVAFVETRRFAKLRRHAAVADAAAVVSAETRLLPTARGSAPAPRSRWPSLSSIAVGLVAAIVALGVLQEVIGFLRPPPRLRMGPIPVVEPRQPAPIHLTVIRPMPSASRPVRTSDHDWRTVQPTKPRPEGPVRLDVRTLRKPSAENPVVRVSYQLVNTAPRADESGDAVERVDDVAEFDCSTGRMNRLNTTTVGRRAESGQPYRAEFRGLSGSRAKFVKVPAGSLEDDILHLVCGESAVLGALAPASSN